MFFEYEYLILQLTIARIRLHWHLFVIRARFGNVAYNRTKIMLSEIKENYE
jgi:hypothetical protein